MKQIYTFYTLHSFLSVRCSVILKHSLTHFTQRSISTFLRPSLLTSFTTETLRLNLPAQEYRLVSHAASSDIYVHSYMFFLYGMSILSVVRIYSFHTCHRYPISASYAGESSNTFLEALSLLCPFSSFLYFFYSVFSPILL